jgi:hypothetical protein
MAVTLYRQVGKGKARRYQKVNLGRGRRATNLAGPHFLRYNALASKNFDLSLFDHHHGCAVHIVSESRVLSSELRR